MSSLTTTLYPSKNNAKLAKNVRYEALTWKNLTRNIIYADAFNKK